MSDQFEAILNGQSPEDTTRDYQCNKPKVCCEQSKLTLTVLKLDGMWTTLTEQIILQNWCLTMHQQKPDDVQEQNVLIAVECFLCDEVVELDRSFVAIEQQALVS